MCGVLASYSDEKIKTTSDQVTTQFNIPISNFVLLNSVVKLNLLFYLFMLARELMNE